MYSTFEFIFIEEANWPYQKDTVQKVRKRRLHGLRFEGLRSCIVMQYFTFKHMYFFSLAVAMHKCCCSVMFMVILFDPQMEQSKEVRTLSE